MTANGRVTAQELAEMVDEPYSTIDHWTRAGVLPCERRGRTRLYDPKTSAKRCRQARQLQNDGHSLVTIRQMLAEK